MGEEDRRKTEAEERHRRQVQQQKEEASQIRDKSPSKQMKNSLESRERRQEGKGQQERQRHRGEVERQRNNSIHQATINPLLSELARKHGAGLESRHTDAVEEIKNAFELAERSSPGITSRLVEQVLSKLQPGLSEGRLSLALDNLSR